MVNLKILGKKCARNTFAKFIKTAQGKDYKILPQERIKKLS